MGKDLEQAQPDMIHQSHVPLSDSFLRSEVPYWLLTLMSALLAVGLYALSRFNYLLFHLLVEFFYIIVAFTVFSIGWNARRFVRNNSLMILSMAFAVIGSIELLHTISYKGMAIFPDIKTNTATQLWVAARSLEAAAFLGAAIVINRKKIISAWLLLGSSILVGSILLIMIWPLGIFPDCFIEGEGLTRFKIVSEYIISLLFGLAILILWNKRERLEPPVFKLFSAAIVFCIVAELSFTLYTDIYGVSNFLGHFFKFLSVVLIYRVLVISNLRSPYAILFRDVHQAKEALDIELAHRRKTEAELRAANRELDAFVRTVSHDLRSPLTPIIGLPELMLDQLKGQLDEQTKKSLHDIRDQGLRMARILEDLLTFARAGRLIDGVASAKIEDVVQNVLEDLGSRIIASNIRIELHEFPDVALPLFLWHSNAVKYAGQDGGPIEIGAELEEDSVVLYVRDHGPGIPVELKEKIFDVFYRGSVSQEEPGSGIGLATVLKIAHCMNGKAWVEETDGGGATFRVRLQKPEPERQQALNFNIP